MPVDLFESMSELLAAHVDRRDLPRDAPVNIVDDGQRAPDFITSNTGLFDAAHARMREAHEQWAGIPLVRTANFGLRVCVVVNLVVGGVFFFN
jgi:hypothetical protein